MGLLTAELGVHAAASWETGDTVASVQGVGVGNSDDAQAIEIQDPPTPPTVFSDEFTSSEAFDFENGGPRAEQATVSIIQ